MKTQTEELKTVVTLDGSKYEAGAKKVVQSAKDMAKSADDVDGELKQLKKTVPQTASAMAKLGKRTKVSVDTSPATKKLDAMERHIIKIDGKEHVLEFRASVDDTSVLKAKEHAESLNKELDKVSKTRSTSTGGAAGGAGGVAGDGGDGGGAADAATGAVAASKAAGKAGKSMVKSLGLIGLAIKGLDAVASGATRGFEIAKQRENNTAAMGFFLGGDEQETQAMMDWATQASLPTKFSEGEVQNATTRALQVTGGDTSKAKKFVNLAQDMASLNPGKTLEDAMEALADADMGEMARMTEFGFKAGKEEFDAAGGDLFAMKSSNKGKTLEEEYDGGVETMAETTDAKIGTAMGILETNLGDLASEILDRGKPAFADLITVVADVAPKVKDVVLRVMDVGGRLFEAVKPLSPIFSFIGTIVGGVLKTAFNAIIWIIENAVIPAFKKIGEKVKPAMDWLAKATEKVAGWFDKVQSALKSFKDGLSQPVTKVVEVVKEKVGGKGRKDAQGSSFFPGGFTQMNENARGEIVDLPRGARIYPYSTTQRIIKKLAGVNTRGGNNNTFHVNIDARGSNLTPEQVHRLKREIVDDIVDAFDNTVPA